MLGCTLFQAPRIRRPVTATKKWGIQLIHVTTMHRYFDWIVGVVRSKWNGGQHHFASWHTFALPSGCITGQCSMHSEAATSRTLMGTGTLHTRDDGCDRTCWLMHWSSSGKADWNTRLFSSGTQRLICDEDLSSLEIARTTKEELCR